MNCPTVLPEVKIGKHRLTEVEVLTVLEALDLYARVHAGQLAELTSYLRQSEGPAVEDACRLVCEAGSVLHPGRAQRDEAQVPDSGIRAEGLLNLIHREPAQYQKSISTLFDRSKARLGAGL